MPPVPGSWSSTVASLVPWMSSVPASVIRAPAVTLMVVHAITVTVTPALIVVLAVMLTVSCHVVLAVIVPATLLTPLPSVQVRLASMSGPLPSGPPGSASGLLPPTSLPHPRRPRAAIAQASLMRRLYEQSQAADGENQCSSATSCTL